MDSAYNRPAPAPEWHAARDRGPFGSSTAPWDGIVGQAWVTSTPVDTGVNPRRGDAPYSFPARQEAPRVTFANTEQAEFWAQLAPTWLELEDQLAEVSHLPGQTAMDRLGLRAGQRVVDLGCGAGRTTLELAARVAPDGLALGVDIAEELLAHARQPASSLGA